MNPDAFICEEGDSSRIDIYRLSSEAKPEQLNYAASTIQSWFPDVSFEVARDSSYMTCELPEQVLIKRLKERLDELDAISRKLKSKTGIMLDNCNFRNFNSAILLEKFLGDSIRQYEIPFNKTEQYIEVC
jgi:hypothetical protein